MMGCHYQDRPCRPSLCLRWLIEAVEAAVLVRCDESLSATCPDRGWDHHTHLDVCRAREDALDHRDCCGARHKDLTEALRCEMASSIRRSFDEQDPARDPVDTRLPATMRTSAWRLIREGVIARDGGRCRLCGKDLTLVPSWMTEVHHVRPKSAGGNDSPSNLLTLCAMCHRRITTDAILASVAATRSGRDLWLPQECLDHLR